MPTGTNKNLQPRSLSLAKGTGAGEPSETSGQEVPSSSKHPENLAPHPRLQSLPGRLGLYPPGLGRHLTLPPGWREGSQCFHPSRRPASLTPHRAQRTSASSQHEWGPLTFHAGLVSGEQGESELAPPPTSSRPPWNSRGAPLPRQPGGLSGGRVGGSPRSNGEHPPWLLMRPRETWNSSPIWQ